MFIKLNTTILNQENDIFYLLKDDKENKIMHLLTPYSYFYLKKNKKLKFIKSIRGLSLNSEEISYTILEDYEDPNKDSYFYDMPLEESDYINFIYLALAFEQFICYKEHFSITVSIEKMIKDSEIFLHRNLNKLVNLILKNEFENCDKVRLMFSNIIRKYVDNGEQYGIYK